MDKPIRVMVAEDFPLLREDFCDVVSSQQDMEVVGAAATGDEIVALARSTLCDVILMDIQMPELDGIEATRRIRAFLPDIPIIAMTAHTMKGDAEKCLEAGMQDHIAKPIDPETLFAALQRARG